MRRLTKFANLERSRNENRNCDTFLIEIIINTLEVKFYNKLSSGHIRTLSEILYDRVGKNVTLITNTNQCNYRYKTFCIKTITQHPNAGEPCPNGG